MTPFAFMIELHSFFYSFLYYFTSGLSPEQVISFNEIAWLLAHTFTFTTLILAVAIPFVALIKGFCFLFNLLNRRCD